MILFVLCFLMAGLSNAVMDKLAHHFYRSVFKNLSHKFWGPESWKNKYEKPWWYPVAFTDGWHLAKSVMLWLMVIGVGLHPDIHPVWAILIARTAFGVGFNAGYNFLLLDKRA